MLKKRLGKKGFTLVEIIVVLVILAILAAILIPSMVKWIEKAEDKGAAVAGRTFLLAAQTIVSEKFGVYAETDNAAISELADIDATLTTVNVTDGKVTSVVFTYPATDGTSYTFTNGQGITAP